MHRHLAAAAVVLSLFLLLPSTILAHNITHILETHPELSTFNHYLTVTQLSAEINRRQTITVCAVDNAAMTDLLAKNLSLAAIKNILSLHVLLDYFDAKKLHQITEGTALAATVFQASGSATGSSGFVNITELKGGKVGFSPKDYSGGVAATFVKSVEAIPYNISVIQISSILPSPEAESAAPDPKQMNITVLMSSHGCKVFAEALLANAAEQTFEGNLQSGLSIFCPGDDAMKNFIPKFKNLTAAAQQSLLEFHGIPIYQSMAGLRSNNGVTSTLATDGASKFNLEVQNNGTDVMIKTKIVTARIVNTVVDNQPLAIYQVDRVLEPEELFKGVIAPVPAPAPAPETEKAPAPVPKAEPPKPSRKRHDSPPAPAAPSDSPADGPDGDVADQTAESDHHSAAAANGGGLGVMVLSVCIAFMQM